MQFGGKQRMYGVADYLAEAANGTNAITNSTPQIGNAVSLEPPVLAEFVGPNGKTIDIKVTSADGTDLGNDLTITNLPNASAEKKAEDGKITNNKNENQQAANQAASTQAAAIELAFLRSKLGDRNFVTLSGEEPIVETVFGSPGATGAVAELEQIESAGTLIDTYALLDVLLNDTDVALTAERRKVLEALRDATEARLGAVLGTVAPTPKAKPTTALECAKKLETKEIVILSLAVAFAIVLVAAILLFVFRRRCPSDRI